MNIGGLFLMLAFALLQGRDAGGAAPGFEKVSGHCYYLLLQSGNVPLVATDEGVLMVNPPDEPDLSLVRDALKRVTSRPVRWLVFTDHRYARTAGAHYYAKQGAQIFAGAGLHDLAGFPLSDGSSTDSAAGRGEEGPSPEISASPWILFDDRMSLYPSGLEVRILAVRHKARSGSDMVLYVPSEKVLFVGDLYESARYPDIDIAGRGSALGWLDAMKQVMDFVPLLKPAIPRVKPEAKSKAEEKTLEEEIFVVSSRDVVSNLQNMKDLLDGSEKLRAEIQRSIKAGRDYNRFLSMRISDPYRSYGNLGVYARHLFQALEGTPGRK